MKRGLILCFLSFNAAFRLKLWYLVVVFVFVFFFLKALTVAICDLAR